MKGASFDQIVMLWASACLVLVGVWGIYRSGVEIRAGQDAVMNANQRAVASNIGRILQRVPEGKKAELEIIVTQEGDVDAFTIAYTNETYKTGEGIAANEPSPRARRFRFVQESQTDR